MSVIVTLPPTLSTDYAEESREEDPPPSYEKLYQQSSNPRCSSIYNDRSEIMIPENSLIQSETNNRSLPVTNPVEANILLPSYAEVLAGNKFGIYYKDETWDGHHLSVPETIGQKDCGCSPVEGICPVCISIIKTEVSFRPGRTSFMIFFVVCFIVGPILALPVCFIPRFQDAKHKCPKCKSLIHVHKRQIVEPKY